MEGQRDGELEHEAAPTTVASGQASIRAYGKIGSGISRMGSTQAVA
jgi:hypothetical protein